MNDLLSCVVKDYSDLITSREQTRAGFISFALEKTEGQLLLLNKLRFFTNTLLEPKLLMS